MTTKITIGKYAKLLNVSRDTIYKRIKRNTELNQPLNTNLLHVDKVEDIGGIKFLHADLEKLI